MFERQAVNSDTDQKSNYEPGKSFTVINMRLSRLFRDLCTAGFVVTASLLPFFAARLTQAQDASAKPPTQKPQVSVKILRQDKYEGKLDGEETTVTMVEVNLDPLAGSPPHRHPGPVSGYVIEGTFEFQVEGGPIQTFKAGDAFFEPKMILHKIGRNPDPVNRTRVLATIVHPSNAKSIVIPELSDQQSRLPTETSAEPGAPPSAKLASPTPETCAIPTIKKAQQTPEMNFSDLTSAAKPTPLTPGLPIVGLLLYDDVLQTEITAPSDVFSKHAEDGKQLFNVITIAASYDLVKTEEGLRLFPDYTFDNSPKLDVIVVPSAYEMSERIHDDRLVRFIQSQNKNTRYTVSNCAGASLIGESGIAKGRKIVTWIGGGKTLQENYPELKVQDDAEVSFVEDGKFLSSNGNLASYISALELLEKMTSKKHRKFVESYLYLDRLQNWNDK